MSLTDCLKREHVDLILLFSQHLQASTFLAQTHPACLEIKYLINNYVLSCGAEGLFYCPTITSIQLFSDNLDIKSLLLHCLFCMRCYIQSCS